MNVVVEGIVNNILRSFLDIFNGYELLRMRALNPNFNPNNFM